MVDGQTLLSMTKEQVLQVNNQIIFNSYLITNGSFFFKFNYQVDTHEAGTFGENSWFDLRSEDASWSSLDF